MFKLFVYTCENMHNPKTNISAIYFDLPVVALLIFGVHHFINAWPLINLFFPFAISPSLSIVLQNQDMVNEWATIFWKRISIAQAQCMDII